MNKFSNLSSDTTPDLEPISRYAGALSMVWEESSAKSRTVYWPTFEGCTLSTEMVLLVPSAMAVPSRNHW